MITQNRGDIVSDFDPRRALKAWYDRGVPEEELVGILKRDFEHCDKTGQPGSAINIQRMLVALDGWVS